MMFTRTASTVEFKRMLARGEKRPPNMALLKDYASGQVDALADRTLRWTCSNADVDREGDVLQQDGWDLSSYRRNPVLLFAHDAGTLPIGRATEIQVQGGALRAAFKFVDADMPVVGPLAEAVFRMARSGFLSAVSVGFAPLKYEPARDRADDQRYFAPLNFTKMELLEVSVVPIPCLPSALIDFADTDGAVGATTGQGARLAAPIPAAKMTATQRELEEIRLWSRLTSLTRRVGVEARAERKRVLARLEELGRAKP